MLETYEGRELIEDPHFDESYSGDKTHSHQNCFYPTALFVKQN